MVIAAQLVAGLGGALILPNSLAILGAAFTYPHRSATTARPRLSPCGRPSLGRECLRRTPSVPPA
ncbi:hypothetical protein QFZ24_008666 [Streptomyces phaeochromogenes]|uniref:hypothetical protein n=1 Tax=Streptomyces TaxID=1883 RepID=UPI00163DB25A|nr:MULTISPECIES: hypothetical protein [Streptomyces]MDQ0954743.1 hypothetical protein [Streptomyces phaeochromogenes]